MIYHVNGLICMLTLVACVQEVAEQATNLGITLERSFFHHSINIVLTRYKASIIRPLYKTIGFIKINIKTHADILESICDLQSKIISTINILLKYS